MTPTARLSGNTAAPALSRAPPSVGAGSTQAQPRTYFLLRLMPKAMATARPKLSGATSSAPASRNRARLSTDGGPLCCVRTGTCMPSNDKIRMAVDGAVARLWLNKPDKLNALDEEMLGEIERRFAEWEAAGDVSVVVLGSTGGRAFCVGADIEVLSR